MAGWRTADGLVVSDRGTWGPDSTAWTGGGAGRSLREGPAGPGWGCDFPINPCKQGSRIPSLGHRPDSTHTRRPPGARGAAPPTRLQRTQACSAPAASPPEGLGRCLPSHPRSLPTGLSARGTLLSRPRPTSPYSQVSDPSRETPPHESFLPGFRTLLGRPHTVCPLVLGSGDTSRETPPCLSPDLGLWDPSRETLHGMPPLPRLWGHFSGDPTLPAP